MESRYLIQNANIDDLSIWMKDFLNENFQLQKFGSINLSNGRFPNKPVNLIALYRLMQKEGRFILYILPMANGSGDDLIIGEKDAIQLVPGILDEIKFFEIRLYKISIDLTEMRIKSFENQRFECQQLSTFLNNFRSEIGCRWEIKNIIRSTDSLDPQVGFVSNNRKPGRPPKYGEWVERINNGENLSLVKAEFINTFHAVLDDPLSAWKRIMKKAARK